MTERPAIRLRPLNYSYRDIGALRLICHFSRHPVIRHLRSAAVQASVQGLHEPCPVLGAGDAALARG